MARHPHKFFVLTLSAVVLAGTVVLAQQIDLQTVAAGIKANGQQLRHFEIRSEDGAFQPAAAEITLPELEPASTIAQQAKR